MTIADLIEGDNKPSQPKSTTMDQIFHFEPEEKVKGDLKKNE